jgi:O-antigen ligase
LCYGAFYLAGYLVAGVPLAQQRPAALLALGAVSLVALGGLLQSAGFAFAPFFWGSSRVFSTLSNPIYFGSFVVLAVPVLLAVAHVSTSRWARYVALSTAAALVAGGYFSYSRAAWLAFPLGLVILVALSEDRRSLVARTLAPPLVIAFIVVLALSYLPGTGPEVYGPVSASDRAGELVSGGGTIATRLEMWSGALELIRERPLQGWGFGTYVSEGARVRTAKLVEIEGYRSYPDRPHNSLLYVAYSTGLMGLALYLAFLAGALAWAGRGLRRVTPLRRGLMVGALAGFAGYLLAEQTFFSVLHVTPVAWAVLGWAAGSSPREKRAGTWALRSRAWVRSLPAYGLLAVALLSAVFGLAHLADITRSRIQYQTARVMPLNEATYHEIFTGLRAAVELDPARKIHWNDLALALAETGVQTGRPEMLAEASEVALQGLDKVPHDPDLAVTYSDLLLQRGLEQEAAEFLEDYLARDAFQADGFFNLGLARQRLGEHAQAVRAFERAVEIVPSDGEAHFYLSESQRALGQRQAAEASLRRAKEIDPALSFEAGFEEAQ